MKNIGDERQPDQKINKFISVVNSISNSCEDKKNGNSQKMFENSHPVAEMGSLSNQVLRDFL
jgi:hypothetical protein